MKKEVLFDEKGNEVNVVEVEEVSWFQAHKKELIIGACVVAAAAVGGVVAYNIYEDRKEERLEAIGTNNIDSVDAFSGIPTVEV